MANHRASAGCCIVQALCLASLSYLVLQVLNDTCSEDLKRVFSQPDRHVDECAFISIDRLGTDVRVRVGSEYSVERLSFNTVCTTRCSQGSCMSQRIPAPVYLPALCIGACVIIPAPPHWCMCYHSSTSTSRPAAIRTIHTYAGQASFRSFAFGMIHHSTRFWGNLTF